ncbi:MAG: serine hydrolase [Bacteroidia bacterium]|nr:serine hydrolase [Bacteroidia bacterium]
MNIRIEYLQIFKSSNLQIFVPLKLKHIQLLILVFLCHTLMAQVDTSLENHNCHVLPKDSAWVDSVFSSLSPDEQIAQMFMVAAFSNKDSLHVREISELIRKYQVGGLIFMQGGPGRQARLTNRYQSLAKVPLMIAIDGEWGLAMRLDSTVSFPRQMMLGAISNDTLIYEMGKEIARQCRRMDINIEFAPVADVNNNPRNPVINSRSFGEDKLNVTRKALAYMHGLQDHGVYACGKHFPGHGDTDIDSHLALPVIRFPKTRLDTLELYPFKQLIAGGIECMMVAHLSVPALDSSRNSITTLSKNVVSGLLKKDLGFKGLVFTDALNMKGAGISNKPGDLELKALLAGNDILLYSENVPKSIEAIKKAVSTGHISRQEIDDHCKKILMAKYHMGLQHHGKINTTGLYADLNNVGSELLNRKLIESSLTLIKNEHGLIPLKRLDTLRIATLSTNGSDTTVFRQYLGLYKENRNFSFNPALLKEELSFTGAITDTLGKFIRTGDSSLIEHMIEHLPGKTVHIHFSFVSSVISDLMDMMEQADSCLPALLINRLARYKQIYTTSFLEDLSDSLAKFNLVIAAINSNDRRPAKNFGISNETFTLISLVSSKTGLILDLFANPYALALFDDLTKVQAILVSYEDNDLTENLSAQLIFGGIPAFGRLPVTATAQYRAGAGIIIPLAIRFKYTIPEESGIASAKLQKIDSLVMNAMNEKAFPGCQVFVAVKGKVIYNRSFGRQTYESSKKVRNSDIYDLASITKIAATTPSLMRLYEQGKFSLDKKMMDYLPFLKKSNKKKMLVMDVLTHQARLQPWIPFYLTTLKNGRLRSDLYRTAPEKGYTIQVAKDLYIRYDYPDSIFNTITQSKLLDKTEFKYSDLGFILFGKAIETMTGRPLEQYVNNQFYSRLGASTLGYHPLQRFPLNRIMPTENDTVFRHQLLSGYVHDPAAAMLGGVSGHAGLFSDANDLAKFMQMLMNYGEYGGERYFSPQTVNLFTTCQFCNQGNRRAPGFDKPEPDPAKDSPACLSATLSSFGHSGFTGTFTWADPEKEIVYVFLSNRVNPDQENNKLLKMNVRTNIQEVIYNVLK